MFERSAESYASNNTLTFVSIQKFSAIPDIFSPVPSIKEKERGCILLIQVTKQDLFRGL